MYSKLVFKNLMLTKVFARVDIVSIIGTDTKR